MSLNILLVDDDPTIAPVVEDVLTHNKVDMSFANVMSGNECLERLRKGFKGLVFMDIMMPEMDGWQTIEKVVEEGLNDGIVISTLTAVDDPPPHSQILAENIVNYVNKPFTPQQLIDAIEDAAMMLTD
ncbi:MAG: response regulator [Planctomycetes bacterium]|nr:response regulator [Planctomycetota bacterium]